LIICCLRRSASALREATAPLLLEDESDDRLLEDDLEGTATSPPVAQLLGAKAFLGMAASAGVVVDGGAIRAKAVKAKEKKEAAAVLLREGEAGKGGGRKGSGKGTEKGDKGKGKREGSAKGSPPLQVKRSRRISTTKVLGSPA
jgi:hypothetical protein